MRDAAPRPLALLALLGASLMLWGCFEEPVVERLHLRFLPAAVEVTARVVIQDRPYSNDSLARRLEQVERSLLSGQDPWSGRFEALRPERESFRWEKERGRLARAERRALGTEPGRLEDFFGDTAVLARYETGELPAGDRRLDGTGLDAAVSEAGPTDLAWASFALYPGPGNRADRQQTRRVNEVLEGWGDLASRYLHAAEDLYRYLERHPERAEACLLALYGDLLEDPVEPEISAREAELVEAVAEGVTELSGVLDPDEDEGYSLDELSRLVYDPFPARITVEVPGEMLEVEGFDIPADQEGIIGEGSRVLKVPGLSLWSSWLALEGVWVFPDPAASFYYLALQDDPDAAFPDLLAAERRAEPAPSPAEVQDAVEDLLRPEPAYRVVWVERRGAAEAAEDEPAG